MKTYDSTQVQPVSVAIIGVGRQGARHLAAVTKIAKECAIRLAALVDTDPLCAAHAHMSGVPFHTGPGNLPAEIDACIVATPTRTHLEVAGALLRRGFDVLVEKPVAANLAQTQALVDLADRHQRIFQVGYLERHHPAYLRHRPEFSSPGRVVSARSTTRTSIQSLPELVRELMIHDLDMLATWLDHEPTEVIWRRVRSTAHEISGVLELNFAGGHRAELSAHSGAAKVVRETHVSCGGRNWSFNWGVPANAGVDPDPITRQLATFVDAVRTRSRPSADGESALKAMRLAERAINALPAAA